jgi:mycothiol synthase
MTLETSDNYRMRTPLPAGYTARPAAIDDVEAAATLLNTCSQALTGRDETSTEALRLEWEVPGFDPATGVRLVFAPGSRLVGYADFFDIDEPCVRMKSWCSVHPNHRERGILAHLLEWAGSRARQSLSKAPAGARVVLATYAIHEDRAAIDVIRRHRFEPVRCTYTMVTDLDEAPPAPQWPDGITVRAMVRGQDERALIEAENEAFRDHWGYVEQPFDRVYEEWMHWIENNPNFDPSLWFIAMDGGEIAGVVLCSPEAEEDPDMGWVESLGVRRPWRRKGLGLALLQYAFGELHRRGKPRVGLGVDARSLTGATRLYEKAGMRVARRYDVFEKELRPGADLSTRSLE